MPYQAPTTGIAAGGSLAFTGQNVLGLIVTAVSLLCLGFTLARLARKVPKPR